MYPVHVRRVRYPVTVHPVHSLGFAVPARWAAMHRLRNSSALRFCRRSVPTTVETEAVHGVNGYASTTVEMICCKKVIKVPLRYYSPSGFVEDKSSLLYKLTQ